MMVEMGPKYDVNKIRFIFVDDFIISKLFDDLGISKTCMTRYDWYHCMQEVWQQSNSFGSLMMKFF